METIQLTIEIQPREPWAEIIVSQLAEMGFSAFEDTDSGVIAYGPQHEIDLELVYKQAIFSGNESDVRIQITAETIPFQNWNALWETDFQPVFVEDRLSILAPFHERNLAKGILIEIQPQMSFGTGHHQTTWLMAKAMLDLEEFPKKVLDMGSGTGVLAILAEKRGADSVLAIDIEDWSVQNAVENSERNACKKIENRCGDVDLISGRYFDMILANINKNVLKAQIPAYAETTRKDALLFLSGFFESDVDEMIAFAADYSFRHRMTLLKEGWAQLSFIKN